MNYLLILLAVSLAVSGLGWIYFIYFFSIGYGFGISALAVTLAVLFRDVLTIPTALLCVVMFIFGCRLGLYLLTREKRSPEYKKILYGPDAAKKKPLFVVIMVWIFCALLYVGQVSPVAFYLANKADGAPVSEIVPWIRTFICRITELHLSNKTLEEQFHSDMAEMYRIYGIEEVSP